MLGLSTIVHTQNFFPIVMSDCGAMFQYDYFFPLVWNFLSTFNDFRLWLYFLLGNNNNTHHHVSRIVYKYERLITFWESICKLPIRKYVHYSIEHSSFWSVKQYSRGQTYWSFIFRFYIFLGKAELQIYHVQLCVNTFTYQLSSIHSKQIASFTNLMLKDLLNMAQNC